MKIPKVICAPLLMFAMSVMMQAVAADPPPVKIVFDTDMGSDIDDVGALAILHHLADLGEVEILGCIYSSGKSPYGGPLCDLINTYFGRPDIPVGANQYDDFGDPKNNFAQRLTSRTDIYKHDLKTAKDVPDMIDVYKKLLRDAAPESVVIVTVGHPIGLYHLMRDKEGAELANTKVRRWIAMGPAWNFSGPGKEIEPLVEDLLSRWKRPFHLSRAGQNVITGKRLVPLLLVDDPVRESYSQFIGRNCLIVGRPSWDQIAVLFAARPDLFKITSFGSTIRDPKAPSGFRWSTESNLENHFLVEPRQEKNKLEDYIEKLMTADRLVPKETLPSLHQIPGPIQIEEYDQGPEGAAYHDTTPQNEGGQLRTDGVDIGPGDGDWFRNSVAWTHDGEWLRYTCDVALGIYSIELHVAAREATSGRVVLELNGKQIADFKIEKTEDSNDWKTLQIRDVPLPATQNATLKIRIRGGGFNIDWVKFHKQ